MNKFKKIMLGALSVLTLGLFAVVGTRVNAATQTSLCDFTSLTGTHKAEYAAGGTELSSDATAVSIKAEGGGATYYMTKKSLGSYSSSIQTSGGNKGFNLVVKKAVTIHIEFAASGGDSYNAVDYAITGDAEASGSTSTSSATAKTFSLAKDDSILIRCSGKRCALFKVSYEETDTSVYSYSYDLNTGTGTVPTGGSVSATGSEADRTISLSSNTATKTNYVFVGWSDGTNTYQPNDSYTLSKNTVFTAVWELNLTPIASDFTFPFTDAAGNGEEIIIENGNLYENSYIKLESSTIINFKTTKEMMLVLTFHNSNLGNGFKLDGENKEIDSATCKYLAKLSVGTHTIRKNGNDVRLGSLALVEESVTPLVQTAEDETYTYVRFITIVKGVEEFDASAVTFSVTMDYAEDGKADKTKIYTPYVAKKITSNGNTYVADVNSVSHTFDNASNPTEYYIVYVLRLTTSKFIGNRIYATTTFGGTDYTSSTVTI